MKKCKWYREDAVEAWTPSCAVEDGDIVGDVYSDEEVTRHCPDCGLKVKLKDGQVHPELM